MRAELKVGKSFWAPDATGVAARRDATCRHAERKWRVESRGQGEGALEIVRMVG